MIKALMYYPIFLKEKLGNMRFNYIQGVLEVIKKEGERLASPSKNLFNEIKQIFPFI